MSILEEVEIKHQAERETLHLLMTRAEEDDQMKTHFQNMSAEVRYEARVTICLAPPTPPPPKDTPALSPNLGIFIT